MSPAVSVLLPVYNAAATLSAAVASIQAQTLEDWELLLVDDGSTDGTAAAAAGLARADGRIRLLRREHGGIVAALNTGLAEARAPLIARMDADDASHPQRLSRQAAFLRVNPEMGLVGCCVKYVGQGEGYRRYVDWTNAQRSEADIARRRFVESPFAHPSVMFRRELCVHNGKYRNGDFPEDYELWLRWMDRGVRMAKLPDMLLNWQDSETRLSRRDARYRPDAFYRIKAQYLARWLRKSGTIAGRPLLIWGAGRATRKRVRFLEAEGIRFRAWVDVDPRKIDRRIDGHPVLAGPDELPPPQECFILVYVGSHGAREKIARALQQHGFAEGQDYLVAA